MSFVPFLAAALLAAPPAGDPHWDPAPQPPVARVSFARETGVCSALLHNGALLHHHEWPEPEGRIRLTISVAGGEIQEGPQERGLTQLAIGAWEHPATRSLTAEQVERIATEHDLTIRAAALPDHLRLSMECPAAHLDAAARLARLMLTEPAFDEAVFEEHRAGISNAIARIGSTRRGVVGEALVGAVFPDDPRLRLTSARERLAAHTAADAVAWLEQILARGTIEAAVVGDTPLKMALEQVAPELAALPAREPASTKTLRAERRLDVAEGAIAAKVTAPALTKRAVVIAGFRGADLSEIRDFRALWIAARVLEERTIARITREGPPLTDLDATSAPGTAFPGLGLVFVVASVSPANAQPAADALRAELEGLLTRPPNADEVSRAASSMARAVARLNSDPGYWGNLLATSAHHGVDADAVARGEADYRSFAPADIAEILGRHNTPDRRFSVIVVPEHDQPAQQP